LSREGYVKMRIKDLDLEYFDPKSCRRLLALRGVDLDVRDGEFVSIVGPSGCGKSTLLKVVSGLLPPTKGAVYVDGVAVNAPGRDRAMVFQSPQLLPWRRVLGNVMYGAECFGVPKEEAKARALQMIKLVGLSGFEDYYPNALSGGMQQRVNLARALVADPTILLMDEPFANLDAQTRELMQLELLRIWREARKTVLFVTHQVDEAVYLSDRVVVFTARPGTVKSIIDVNMPRPRELKVKRTPEFIKHVERIWDLLEEEIKKTLLAEKTA